MLPENDLISRVYLTIDRYKGSLKALKHGVVENDYSPKSCNFVRSLIWKAVYITESLNIKSWNNKLNDSRIVYHELIKRDDMIVPWYKLDSDSPYHKSVELSRNSSLRRKKKTSSSSGAAAPLKKKSVLMRVKLNDDPLSGGSEADDEDLELLKTIILDTDRLFPGEDFFAPNSPIDNRNQLIEVLYIWAKCNPNIGYKQGFHEIMGLLYMNIKADCVEIPRTNTIPSDDLRILNMFDSNYLCHDLFTIFNKFMVSSGVISNFYEEEAALMKSLNLFNSYLMKVDQLIHYNLVSKLKLETQLWCIRYLRLLLLREIGHDLSIISILWDKVICLEGDTLDKVPQLFMFLVIVLLINMKSDLIICDFSEGLSLLLHYPIELSMKNERSISFINDLFKDAAKLFKNRDNDLKLYEYGRKLSDKYNPDLRFSLSYKSSSESARSRTASPAPNGSQAPPRDSKTEKMAFEKYRLEMRLKKKAQALMRP